MNFAFKVLTGQLTEVEDVREEEEEVVEDKSARYGAGDNGGKAAWFLHPALYLM